MLESVLAQAASDFADHLELLQRHLRQPSISPTGEGITEMVEMLAADLTRLGGRTEIVQTPEFPVVYSRIDAGAPCTVLIHSMYDVVEADEPGWLAPPFSATRMDLWDFGDCIVGRGAEDTKGR